MNNPVTIGTESVYKGLFDMYSNEIAQVVGAPKGCDDETLRDYLGEYALDYLSNVELSLTTVLKGQKLTGLEMASLCFSSARAVRPFYVDKCRQDSKRALVD